MEGMNQIRVYCMHVWKYHKKTPVQLLCTNTNVKINKEINCSRSKKKDYAVTKGYSRAKI
jgi:hypothetical protein